MCGAKVETGQSRDNQSCRRSKVSKNRHRLEQVTLKIRGNFGLDNDQALSGERPPERSEEGRSSSANAMLASERSEGGLARWIPRVFRETAGGCEKGVKQAPTKKSRSRRLL
jgi:hypothetical protein